MYIYFCSGVNIAIDELVCFLENLCRLGVPVNEVNEHGRYELFAVSLISC